MPSVRALWLFAVLVLAGCSSPATNPTTPSGHVASAWQPSSVVSIDASPAPLPQAEIQWLGDGAARNLEPSFAVDPLDANHLLVAWTLRDRAFSAGGAPGGASAEVAAAQSLDGGETWNVTVLHDPTLAPLPGTYPDAYDQRAAFLPDGTAVVVYIGESQRFSSTVAPADRITMASSRGGAPWSYHIFAETMSEKWDYTGLAVAPDTGYIYVATSAFFNNSIQYWRSTNEGVTWEGPVDPFGSLSGGSPRLDPSTAALLKNPSVAALEGGVVVVSAYAGLLSHSDGMATFGPQLSVASHDDGQTFGTPRIVPAGLNGYLVTQSIASTPGSNLLRTVSSDDKGAILFSESENGGDSWSNLAPLGQNGGSKPYWAVFDSGANGVLDTLVRSGDGAAPWRISLFCSNSGGTPHGFELAHAARMPPPGVTGGNQSDDYGGIARTRDGVVYAAFADPRDVDGARIAVARLRDPCG